MGFVKSKTIEKASTFLKNSILKFLSSKQIATVLLNSHTNNLDVCTITSLLLSWVKFTGPKQHEMLKTQNMSITAFLSYSRIISDHMII